MILTSLFDWLSRFYHYKLVSISRLIIHNEWGYLIGVLFEKTTGYNPYLWYRERRNKSLIVERTIRGHRMALDLSDPGVSRRLFMRRDHEPDATDSYLAALELVLSSKSADPITLEIGANIGYNALLQADLLGENGRVFAFEPNPDNRTLLKRNRDVNRFEHSIEIFPFAISDTNGTSTLALSDQSNLHRLVDEQPTTADTIDVGVRSIDSILSERDISASSVVGVRMDIEGHEFHVLQGMIGLLESDKPLAMFLEIHPERLEYAQLEEMIELLRTHKFEIHFVGQDRRWLEIDSYSDILDTGGSHIRLVLSRT